MASDPAACVEFVLPVAEVRAWLETAPIGATLLYCHAAQPIYGETWTFVGELGRSGQVHPKHPPSPLVAGFRAFQITVLRTSEAAVAAEPARAGAGADEEADKILRILRRCANFNRKCPTNPELAKSAGLSTPNQVAWRLKLLAGAGQFRIATVKDGPEAGHRTIVFPDGRSTMPPASAEAIAATVWAEPEGGDR